MYDEARKGRKLQLGHTTAKVTFSIIIMSIIIFSFNKLIISDEFTGKYDVYKGKKYFIN